MRRALGTLFLLLLALRIGYAQEFNFETQREPVISLDGRWRFHVGDDPRWADPNFDDRSWSLLRSDRRWGQQGYKDNTDMAWYRFRVQVSGEKPLMLLLAGIADSYQVFANGQLIGGLGEMPPHPEAYRNRFTLFSLTRKRHSPTLNLAIRVWRDPRTSYYGRGGGPVQGGSLLGDPQIVTSRYRAIRTQTVWSHADSLILLVLELIAGLTALSLYLMVQSESEYLWYALAQLLSSANRWLVIYLPLTLIPRYLAVSLFSFQNLSALFYVLFFRRLFGCRRTWLFWSALLTPALFFSAGELWEFGYAPFWLIFTAQIINNSIIYGWIVWTAWQATRRGLIDARLLFGPLLFSGIANLASSILSYLVNIKKLLLPRVLTPLYGGIDVGMFQLKADNVTDFLVLLAVLAVLIVRFSRTHREEEQHARELEAARTVQQILVPEELPAIPGFAIASIYQPAQQVGGDFFQVIPLTNGVLVAIGDVSGKGLPAAMTVSLIVGTLRTLAEHTQSPAAILQGLNRTLVGRSSGFTTCLITFLLPDGNGAMANAGHLPPYCNGEEIDTLSNLPLGLSLDMCYGESPLILQPNDRLTFVSDGIVEAKNAQGELFGFDRMRLNSTQPADAIAKTAMQFGQQDDITVLTIQYLEPAAVCWV